MKKSIEERLKYAIENDKLKFEKFLGNGCKWYNHYLEIWELTWARNLRDGYKIHVYDSEEKREHFGTFLVEYTFAEKGYHLVPKLQKQ